MCVQYMPHVALTGGFTEMNPNLFNGFRNRFSGVWNVGVVLQVPIWNWGEAEIQGQSIERSDKNH